MSGITLLAVPSIMFGGASLLGILTGGEAGVPQRDLQLTEMQWSLFRAGHAHAGVLVILSLVIQILLDSAVLSTGAKWLARICAPAASVMMSGGFFGLAFLPVFRWLLYLGAAALALALIVSGVGLVRRPART
jgi:hypothetical protein